MAKPTKTTQAPKPPVGQNSTNPLSKELQDLYDNIIADLQVELGALTSTPLLNESVKNHIKHVLKAVNDKSFKFETKQFGFRQTSYVWNLSIPSPIDPERYIRISYTLELITPGIKYVMNWKSIREAEVELYQISQDWRVREALHKILYVKYKNEMHELFADAIENVYNTRVVKHLNKYIARIRKKEEQFNEGAEERALQSLVRYVHDKKINFSVDEIKMLLPYLINKRDELYKLTRWCTSNRKLSKKVNNDVLEKVEDNITILDILE